MRHRKLNEICQSRINQNNWFEPSPDESDFTAEELQTALEQLSKEQQEIVVAKIWGELTFEEIADLTNSSRSRIHRIYQHSLTQLREILQNKLQ
jgi:RNA polymerase sigma-70 factor (ECF subfamily)